MDRKIKNLLDKVLPKLRKEPKKMEGFDLSREELNYISENDKMPLAWLREVAWDNFFECCNDELGISNEEALELRKYLVYESEKEKSELVRLSPWIELTKPP